MTAMAIASFLGLPLPSAKAQTVVNTTIPIGTSDIGGVATSSNGLEAGVWVIAETKDLPTRFIRIASIGVSMIIRHRNWLSFVGRPLFGALMLFALATTLPAARAESGAGAGKTITLLVGQPAGGAYDGYARILAQYLPKFLAGAPHIVVENMPGAGGVTMADFLSNEAPKDGTSIGLASGAIGTAELFKFPGVRFDPRKISWVGNLDAEIGEAISWQTAPVKTAQDLFEHELVVAGTGAASNSVIFPRAMNKVIGTKFNVIPGYHGSGEMALALQRGEVEGIGSNNYSDMFRRTRSGSLITR